MKSVLDVVSHLNPTLHIPNDDFRSQDLLQLDLSPLLSTDLNSLLLNSFVKEVSSKHSLDLFGSNSLSEISNNLHEFGVRG